MKNNFLNLRIALAATIFLGISFSGKVNAQYVPMTFHNGSSSSIYLQIPGVMNPSLNPMSDSGISLKFGQKVYFFPKGQKGKKELLFTVNSAFTKDTVLQIDQMVRARKKELGFK